MPAWWKGKSKSKPKATSSPREPLPPPEEDEGLTPKHDSGRGKGSLDEALVFSRSREASPISAAGGGSDGCGMDAVFGHPLPLPKSISSPLPIAHEQASSASASASSISSSTSSDGTPELGYYRFPDAISMAKGRNVASDLQSHQYMVEDGQLFSRIGVLENPKCFISSSNTRREFQENGCDASSNGRTAYGRGLSSTGTLSGRRTAVSSPGSRGHTLPASPVHSGALGLCPISPNQRQDNLKSPFHPLPLPPSSPSSCPASSSHSPKAQWKKGKLLGRGTFGHVYLGFNSESGQMCAIKEVKDISADANSKECLRQLSQEIALLSQLSHPNIVQYYGSELAEDTLSVYLEFVSGGSIHKLLQEYGPFSEHLIRSYTAQILSGLSYLHERNTVHRDIKGANILVDPNGEIKLADFGMAKHISSYTSMRSFKGSPYWMAPEIIMNASGYNLSVDIWSLGCTVLEMATSKPPWSQYEGVAAIFKIGNSKDIPEIPDHFSYTGKDFLRTCLQRDPMARPSAIQLMDHPFVRDQVTAKTAKFDAIRDTLPTFSKRSVAPMMAEFSSNSSSLHDREYGIRQTSGLPREPPPLAYTCSRNLTSLRLNMSLPVSPCSSPLRQFRRSNRSCLPSPPHPAYSAGAVNYSPVNNVLYPSGINNNIPHTWRDIDHVKAQTLFDSPRRLKMDV